MDGCAHRCVRACLRVRVHSVSATVYVNVLVLESVNVFLRVVMTHVCEGVHI